MARGQIPPRSIAVHVPIRVERDHHITEALGLEVAGALSAAMPGATITCQVPEWLLDHYVIRAGMAAMAAGAPAELVARRYGKHPSAWSRLWQSRNRKPRLSPLDVVGDNIAQEVVALLLLRKRQFVPISAISANLT
ncbi:hypothetical protein [Roseicyclus amphidinii]|uniref:hypothetical protein n=1 Tax=Roseicyclus amphidinii TaxID=3034232 RepID=UPI0024E14596|nr:hypothetical protein [Roseicyclus sp. Amp-Y-6]